MKYFRKFITIGIFFSLFYAIFSMTSYAYIDPGTGSYFLQIIIGVFIGMAFAVKIYLKSIKAFFINILKKGKNKKNNG